MIKGNDYAIEIQKEHSSSLRRFKNETEQQLYRKQKTDKFGVQYKVDRIDFSKPRSNGNYYTDRALPYYVGEWEDPGSVEVSN